MVVASLSRAANPLIFGTHHDGVASPAERKIDAPSWIEYRYIRDLAKKRLIRLYKRRFMPQ